MFEHIKKLLTRSYKEERQVIDHMFKTGQPCVEAGKKLAEDGFFYGLRNGKAIYLSDLENHIKLENYLAPNAVLYGFNQGMKQYIDSKEVVCFDCQDNELIYIHKDYVDTFLGKRDQKSYIQEVFDDFFKDLHVINAIATQDIPLIIVDGDEQRSTAEIFFSEYSNCPPYQINSPSEEIDVVLLLFDTFCVLEMNPNNDLSKQFIVLQHVSNEIDDSFETLAAMDLMLRIMPIKQAILEMKEPFEVLFFKKVCDFFIQHKQEGIEILKRKYS